MTLVHRYVLGTSTGSRRSRRKYSAKIAGGTSAMIVQAAGPSVLRNSSVIRELIDHDDTTDTTEGGSRSEMRGLHELFMHSYLVVVFVVSSWFILNSRSSDLSHESPPAQVVADDVGDGDFVVGQHVVHAAAGAEVLGAAGEGVERLSGSGPSSGALTVISASSASSQSTSFRSPFTSGSSSSCERTWMT